MKNRKRLIIIVSVVVILLVTLGISVAIFSSAQSGVKDSSMVVGSLKFKYTELSGTGNSISIEDAEPVSDTDGKVLDTYFDFKIEAKSLHEPLTYQVVVEPTEDTTLPLNAVKFYLTELDNDTEVPVFQTIADNGKVKNLLQYDNTNLSSMHGKVVYLERIPANTDSYLKRFRARAWLNEDVDANDYIGTTAAFRINVYTDTSTALDALHLTYASKINPDTNQPYTTCTEVQCALDELFTLANQ